ncbi:hypothetical protein [Methylomonas methanica]|uniref:Uncharacterized protein n=1 Tax=Methylomonas methanica (strain DSM 25384 / MC09) TaxID=857087 RepID=F9ZX39_METMM|nr:hypothetical protein [Methylomonas methanica]AEF98500.1 hypothetical protein Metme_0046 [Methylomonas methanica MC09]
MKNKKATPVQESDLLTFSNYLNSLTKETTKYQPWELRVLGGFGGYKSQVSGKAKIAARREG